MGDLKKVSGKATIKLALNQRYGCQNCKSFLIKKTSSGILELNDKNKKIRISPQIVSFLCTCGVEYSFEQ